MKKLLSYVLISSVVLLNGFWLFEGGFASADTSSTESTTVPAVLQYNVTTDVDAELTLTCDVADLPLVGDIDGVTGGNAVASRDCVVVTNDSSGYAMTADVGTLSRNGGGGAFGGYAVGDTWAAPIVTGYDYGFTVSGADTAAFVLGTGNYAPSSGGPVAIAAGSGVTNNVTTTISYKAEAAANSLAPSGSYTSVVVISASLN